jgi:hypothetical protein
MARRRKTRRRRAMIHPSITALAGASTIGKFLNAGYDPSTTVIKSLQNGDFGGAVKGFMNYSEALVTTSKGRTALTKGIGITILGGVARKLVPNVKLGFGKFYARI